MKRLAMLSGGGVPVGHGALVYREGVADGLGGATVGQQRDDAGDGLFVVATAIEHGTVASGEGPAAVATAEPVLFLGVEADVALAAPPVQGTGRFHGVHAAAPCLKEFKTSAVWAPLIQRGLHGLMRSYLSSLWRMNSNWHSNLRPLHGLQDIRCLSLPTAQLFPACAARGRGRALILWAPAAAQGSGRTVRGPRQPPDPASR